MTIFFIKSLSAWNTASSVLQVTLKFYPWTMIINTEYGLRMKRNGQVLIEEHPSPPMNTVFVLSSECCPSLQRTKGFFSEGWLLTVALSVSYISRQNEKAIKEDVS